MLSLMRERHRRVAEAAAEHPAILDVFERMEIELGETEAMAANDPITQARRRLEARRMIG